MPIWTALCFALAANDATLIDLHVDTVHQVFAHGRRLRGRAADVNLATMAAGDVGAAFFAIWVPARARDHVSYAERAYAAFKRMLAETKGAVVQARNAAEIRAAWAAGKRVALLAIEGAHALGDDPERLRVWRARGLVALGLTWTNSNAFAESDVDEAARRTRGENGRGLTKLGERLVALADELGVLIDTAHASAATLRDVTRISRQPPIASHTASRALCRHHRNLTDDSLRLIASRGGVVGLTFHGPHVRCGRRGRASLADIVLQLAHMKRVAGIDAIAIGSDYDGMIVTPTGLPNAASFKKLRTALRKSGFSADDISRIFQKNVLRVLERLDPMPAAGP
ncbi:MAG: membrane dipeptidase [Deltaproteobacteria bacterium]|nr:membrane dipeptidase [Deltaproteobacteria bacterium]